MYTPIQPSPPFLERFLEAFSAKVSSTLCDTVWICQWYQTDVFSASFSFLEKERNHWVPNHWITESFIVGRKLTIFHTKTEALLLLVICQDPEHKFHSDTVHVQLFHQTRWYVPLLFLSSSATS
jgi:hypothetical protein